MKLHLGWAIAGLMISGTSFAGGWRQSHPRRAEVNARLAHQNARIRDGVEDGQLTRGQARQLHAEDRAIRQEERAMAAKRGGHLTQAQQRQLNQQENQVSRQIETEKHAGK